MVTVLLVAVFATEVRRSDVLPPALPVFVFAAPSVADRSGSLASRCHAIGFHGSSPPRKTVDIEPRYPDAARAAGARGVVLISAYVDERGDLLEPRVIRSIPLLDEAALNAVRRWKFAPAISNGAPACVAATLAVAFP